MGGMKYCPSAQVNTRMVLTLLFVPSTFFHQEKFISKDEIVPYFIGIKNNFITFHIFTPEWLLVESNLYQRGCSCLLAKFDCFPPYPVSFELCHIFSWLV